MEIPPPVWMKTETVGQTAIYLRIVIRALLLLLWASRNSVTVWTTIATERSMKILRSHLVPEMS
jgi:hypothetical protein